MCCIGHHGTDDARRRRAIISTMLWSVADDLDAETSTDLRAHLKRELQRGRRIEFTRGCGCKGKCAGHTRQIPRSWLWDEIEPSRGREMALGAGAKPMPGSVGELAEAGPWRRRTAESPGGDLNWLLGHAPEVSERRNDCS